MTSLPLADPSAPEAQPRRISRRPTGSDAIFVNVARAIGASVLVITGGVGVFLAWQAVPTLRRYGFSFLTEQRWQPEADIIGIAGVLVGTVSIALVAMFFAFPLALLSALYISEYAPAKIKGLLVSAVDLMAAIPSIVYGLWGFFLMMPHAAELAWWLQRHFGWVPFFKIRGTDPDSPVWDTSRYVSSAFCAGIAVAMMVLPMACAVMRQVFSQTPPGEREAALALGATKWGVIRSVVLPFGRGGIIGGTMLGLGRALGETIAVVLIISPAFEIKWNVLETGANSVSALIAVQFGDATPAQLSALLAAGFVLFLITLAVNTFAAVIVNRSRSGADADA
ncbi:MULTISPECIES: phosphate ABC transporter permease subunit PstC [Pimelobacter]|uniref:phosphate ABC transporter permease subunit PstC n=1 Tax=Pimelobacter TaxID=2044 RepID=UPI0021504D69|nr:MULTISPECIES: phosphate ABC transporter permease subunit PstC [Pimelobacter]MBU2697928.1 phosphate ABC transporter permease subunit PstC [Pimelobacter sp. 30-1]UUW92418.1 phosphate ABC transporter permease subunit PstC [Pimelobacter simplex]UUW96246.1 phosphate ABC transporter permease subunit PstC [Pimelobacter simplex]